MEDPWGSPWATDTPAPPTISLPSEPQQAHYGNSPRRSSPSPSPWGRDIDIGVDNWGGWNEPTAGRVSPGWGSSPNLKPLGSSPGIALDPWALPVIGDKEGGKGSDSAIGMGDDGRMDAHDDLTGQIEESGVWDKRHVEPMQEDVAERIYSADMEPMRLFGDRQVSKVQELVEMYDDMAKTSRVEASSTERVATKDSLVTEAKFLDDVDDESVPDAPILATSICPIDNEDTAPEANNCEIREAWNPNLNTKAEESNIELQPISEPSDSRVPIEVIPVEEEDANPNQETQYNSSTRSTNTTKNKTLPHKLRASISYPIDFSSLNILFPNTQVVDTIPEELPESIQGSFTSVSQRKAWHRISRFGSIRKHNDGDDDNYVRVGWKTSTVRKDTLTTVRRWMEEDSIGGRVVLGRRLGHGGSSMFNWDSEAPAVEIGELLARKKQKPKGHAQQLSATLTGVVTSPTIASFGWSSNVPSSPATERISSDWHAKSSRPSETTERDGAEEKRLSTEMVEPHQSPKPTAAQVVPPVLEPVLLSQDEDDDWGDMVSCPNLEFTATFDNTISLTDAANSPTSRPDAEELVSEANEAVHTLHVPTEELDHWGDSEFFGGNDSVENSVQPIPSTKGEAVALLRAPENACMPASLAQPTQDEPIRTSWESSSLTPSRPESIELASCECQDDESVAAILAGLPDLSYMLR